MRDRIKRLYDAGVLTKDAVKNAVVKGLITTVDYAMITGEDYDG